MTRTLDRLSLGAMRFDRPADLFGDDRDAPQPVQLDITLHFHGMDGRGDPSSTMFDHSRLLGELHFVLIEARFDRLESFAEAAAAWLLMPPSTDVPRPPVEAVDILLSNPASPALEIHRTRADFKRVTETQPFGFVDIVFETDEAGVYRERIYPHTVLPTHVHRHLDEAELVLGDGLLLQGAPVAAGTAHAWPRNFPHRYENPTDIEQSFLCIDRPRFIPTDEVEVDLPTATLTRTREMRFF